MYPIILTCNLDSRNGQGCITRSIEINNIGDLEMLFTELDSYINFDYHTRIVIKFTGIDFNLSVFIYKDIYTSISIDIQYKEDSNNICLTCSKKKYKQVSNEIAVSYKSVIHDIISANSDEEIKKTYNQLLLESELWTE